MRLYNIYVLSFQNSSNVSVVAARSEEKAKSLVLEDILMHEPSDIAVKLRERFNQDLITASNTRYKADGEVLLYSYLTDVGDRNNSNFWRE